MLTVISAMRMVIGDVPVRYMCVGACVFQRCEHTRFSPSPRPTPPPSQLDVEIQLQRSKHLINKCMKKVRAPIHAPQNDEVLVFPAACWFKN